MYFNFYAVIKCNSSFSVISTFFEKKKETKKKRKKGGENVVKIQNKAKVNNLHVELFVSHMHTTKCLTHKGIFTFRHDLSPITTLTWHFYSTQLKSFYYHQAGYCTKLATFCTFCLQNPVTEEGSVLELLYCLVVRLEATSNNHWVVPVATVE